MAARFSKTGAPQMTNGPFINSNNSGDLVIGASLSAGAQTTQIGASQYAQNIPGDRFIFTPSDALAITNPVSYVATLGFNLYTGTYRYVAVKNNSTSIPQPGRAGFWARLGNNANNDMLYEVTSDENATLLGLFAGVFINWVPVGGATDSYWFIQESGKATVQFQGNNQNGGVFGANLAAASVSQGVYLAGVGAANANNTVGLFSQVAAGNVTDANLRQYMGPAETAPSNGNFSIVDINLRPYRW
jgi:hypothetical protein